MENNQQKGDDNAPFTIYSAEELKILRECNVESFYFRCIPFSAAFSAAAYYAISRGHWKMSARFGYTPKMMGMAIIGYFIGKVSYTNQCANKFMKLPNSQIGEALRKKKGMTIESDSVDPTYTISMGPEETPLFDDHRPDIRDRNDGIDEYNKVTESLAPYIERTEREAELRSLNYADLRKQNREDHNQRVMGKFSNSTEDPASASFITGLPINLNDEKPAEIEPPNGPPPRKNKYGDVID